MFKNRYLLKRLSVRSLIFMGLIYISVGGLAKAQDLSFPFDPEHENLYTSNELWAGYSSTPSKNKSLDWKVFEYFVGRSKYNPSFQELSAQRSHDSHMDVAIDRFFELDEDRRPRNKKVIVILGAHATLRSDPLYARMALLTYELTKNGYFVVSGGGPGMMEASHVGAYMGKRSPSELHEALSILAKTSVPLDPNKKQYEMPDYWDRSNEVLKKFPTGEASLGIPTWFYGHEGANAFSTYVAKYFSNALREEKVCSIAFYGVIVAPGGPGTAQEVFMEAAENGYASYGWYRPMIFFDDSQMATDYVSFIQKNTTSSYRRWSMLKQTTQASEVIEFLKTHPPQMK